MNALKKSVQVFKIAGILLCLSACAPINTDFSCDKTAMDGCMDMGEVDDKSKDGTTIETWSAKNTLKQSDVNTSTIPPITNASQRIWLAPYTDGKGQYHGGSFVYVNLQPHATNSQGI